MTLMAQQLSQISGGLNTFGLGQAIFYGKIQQVYSCSLPEIRGVYITRLDAVLKIALF